MRQIMCVLMVGLVGITGCGDDTGDSANADGGTPGQDAAVGGEDAGTRDKDAGRMLDDAAVGGKDAGDDEDASVALDAGGSGSKDCEADEGKLSVDIDGVHTETCMTMLSAGGLNHAFGTLDGGDKLIINFTGQVPADDVCVGIGMRKGSNATTMNDWMSGPTCVVDIDTYGASGERVKGTFSATVKPSNGNTDPDRVLTNGSFDVVRP